MSEAFGSASDPLTEKILGCAYAVSNELGAGFLEKVYENAMAIELRNCGLHVEQQAAVHVRYQDHIVGEFFVDLIVNRTVIVELKAARKLDEAHVAQCLNYLKATGFPVCLLLNFGTARVEVKRLVFGSRVNQPQMNTDEHR